MVETKIKRRGGRGGVERGKEQESLIKERTKGKEIRDGMESRSILGRISKTHKRN